MSDLIAQLHSMGKFDNHHEQDISPEQLDPTMASCCARELESNRLLNQRDVTLRKYDRVALAEKARRMERYVVDLDFGKGCGCSYDPSMDGGEYAALIQLREERRRVALVVEEENVYCAEEVKDNVSLDEEEDSDEDSEFDYLLDEPLPGGDEEKRLHELEELALYNSSLEQHGFGLHIQMHPSRLLRAAAMRSASGKIYPAVVHLFDAESRLCAEMDICLEEIGKKYRGSRFLRGDGRAVILLDSMIAQHLDLKVNKDVPSILCFKEGKLIIPPQDISLFSDKANGGTIVPDAVEQWLDYAGMLSYDTPPFHELCRVRPEEEAMLDYISLPEEKTPEEEFHYDCGLANCKKMFAHEHIGIETSQQSGRLVSDPEFAEGFWSSIEETKLNTNA